MNIPEVRKELMDIALSLELHGFNEISEHVVNLINELKRRPYVRKCRDKSKHADVELYARLRAKALANPDMTYQEIAISEGVNAGRVSEACAGKRR